MKEQYITITGLIHYYGILPFKIGKKIKCVKEPANLFDHEAIRCELKHVGTVGYIANSPYTVVRGTKSAGKIGEKVQKEFKVEVMFVTDKWVICKVIKGFKEKKKIEIVEPVEIIDTGEVIFA